MGDVVIVVDPTKIRQPQMTRERRGFAADALHHAPVARQGVNVVIEHWKVRSVISFGEPFTSDGHSDACRNTLAKRSSRCLHPRRPTVLGMAGAFAFELTELFEVFYRDRELAQIFVFAINRLDRCQV